ncbi:MAG: chemotaxis protein CheA [Cycloclasticus sp.]|nr:chemotaxis protein CheA [Cycloclasticus sp.]MBQ0789140.1 chemotaxis protein CheA [Cycloclasticus sp.]
MAIDLDDEILQDFLVEAGEILEQLNDELIALERSPDDVELLNSIFRGFHTIKGGAGFLSLDPLVDICHIAEDVFDILRNGERVADAALMDTILRALDVVNEMFGKVRDGEEPEPASQELIAEIAAFKLPATETARVNKTDADEQPVEPMQEQAQVVEEESVSDEVQQEFEAMLKSASQQGQTTAPKTESQADSDEITEEEFERLLDELHGKNKAPSVQPDTNTEPAKKADTGDISEAEFDQLMDDLHGKGQGPKGSTTDTAKQPVAQTPAQTTEKQKNAVQNNAALSAKNNVVEAAKPLVEKDPKSSAKQAAETSVRVDTKRLDEIMNMVGELVLVRNRLTKLRAGHEEDEMTKAISNLDIVTADLQLAVMKTRMQPIKKVFGRFPRVVRDLARGLNKKISLELVGEETDLDKNLVEALSDPLVHLVRNAVDHGIETPEQRLAAGKSEEGLVVLSAFQEGDHILLTIEDNGKGMDADVLRSSAVSKGMMDEEAASRLTDIECYNLIFAAGFSTKTEISDVSGRGVGMDVVKTRISGMNGTVHVESELGVGSKIIIKLPLTLAIMSTLMVKLSEQVFALPLSSVVEILSLDLSNTNLINGELVVLVRGKAVPLYYLNEWLIPNYQKNDQQEDQHQHVVVVSAGHQHIGFVVDQLLGQEEVVIKPLGALLTQVEGLAGATITGDGGIAIILDIPSMLKRYT